MKRFILYTVALFGAVLLHSTESSDARLLKHHNLDEEKDPPSDHDDDDDSSDCPCKLLKRPDLVEKAPTARWMAHSLDWGVLSTISSRLDGDPTPFGNIYSFVDGTCHNSTGVPYIYGTYLDQSFTDISENRKVSFTLTEASLSSVCTNKAGLEACTIGTRHGDPENPVCARLTLTGVLEVLEETSEEFQFAQGALFERHETMKAWPKNHDWVIAKVNVEDVWLIDYFGGATILTPETYFEAGPPEESEEE